MMSGWRWEKVWSSRGQQVDRHAQPGANAHLPHLQPVELGGLAEQLLVLLADRPDGGQEGLPSAVRRTPNRSRARSQTQLVLQPGDDVADGRLGVTQNLRSLGKAAQVCGLQSRTSYFLMLIGRVLLNGVFSHSIP